VETAKEFFMPEEESFRDPKNKQKSVALPNSETDSQNAGLNVFNQHVSYLHGVALLDKDDIVRFWSPAAESILGFKSSEIVGKTLKSRISVSQEPEGNSHQPDCDSGELSKSSCSGEIRRVVARCSNGIVLPVEVSFSEVDSQWGKFKVVIFRDIFEEKKAAREHEQLQDQFVQAQKMEAVGQMAGGIAHDFNNILTTILMQLSVLQYEQSPSSEIGSQLAEMEAQALRAAALTRQLLLFSRHEPIRTECVNLVSLVENEIKLLRRIIGENIHLELLVSAHACGEYCVKADPGRIEQVIMNLAINARDAMAEGGLLKFKVDCHDFTETARVHHSNIRTGKWIQLSIIDTGCGMTPETQSRIFEPFFTTKKRGRGTGLGLATVYSLIKQHDGWIEVESVPGKGSTFSIYLPAQARTENQPAEPPRINPPEGGSETLLLVEDEKAVRKLVCGVLRQRGYVVLEAENALEGFQLWELHSESIRLLITDVIMPGGTSGWELAETLLQKQPSLRTLFISGYTEDMALSVLVQDPRVYFMSKPLEAKRFTKIVREILDA